MELIPQFVINSLIAGSLYTIVALSFNLMYATGRFFNLAIGGLIPVGGYGVLLVSVQWGTPLWVGMVAGVMIAGSIGFALDRFVYSYLRTRKASSMILLIASLGAFIALQAGIAMIFSSNFQALPKLSLQSYDVFGGTMTAVQALIIFSAMAVTAATVVLLKWTAFGTAVRAISDDIEVSKIVGIDTEKVLGIVFFAASALSGYAGVLMGLDVGLDPLMGFLPMVAGIVGAVVGGIGEAVYGFAGSYVLSFFQNAVIVKLSTEWSGAITYVLLIVFLLFRPRGLFRR